MTTVCCFRKTISDWLAIGEFINNVVASIRDILGCKSSTFKLPRLLLTMMVKKSWLTFDEIVRSFLFFFCNLQLSPGENSQICGLRDVPNCVGIVLEFCMSCVGFFCFVFLMRLQNSPWGSVLRGVINKPLCSSPFFYYYFFFLLILQLSCSYLSVHCCNST